MTRPWGRGRTFQRAGVWWISFCAHGREVRESAKSRRRRDAQSLLRRRMEEVSAGQFVDPSAGKKTVSGALDDVIRDLLANERRGVDSVRFQIKAPRRDLGSLRIVDVNEAVIARYVEGRLNEGYANATINRELAWLRRALRLAHERGGLARVPKVRLLREANAREGFVSPEQFERVAANLPPQVDDFARFLFLAGWRKGEAANLTWRDVDIEGRTIRLPAAATKSGHARTLPLEGALLELVQRRAARRAVNRPGGGVDLTPYVFHREGRKIGDIRRPWKRAVAAAGLPGLLVHDLRRSACKNLVKAGVAQHVIMAVMGHRTPSMFRRYAIVDEQDLREGMRRGVAYVAAHQGTEKKPPANSPKEPSSGAAG